MECGNERKSDVMISVEKNESGTNRIEIESKHGDMFYKSIRELIEKHMNERNFSGFDIRVKDFGAWDYAITARLEACLAEMEAYTHDA